MNFFQQAVIDLPPTPSKFHYIFNVRDLSRITMGLLQSDPSHFKLPQQFVRLWRNEFTRVFCDRLISKNVGAILFFFFFIIFNFFAHIYFQDQELIFNCMENLITSTWESDQELTAYTLRNPLLFGDFRNACSEDEIRLYEDLLDYEAVFNLFMEVYPILKIVFKSHKIILYINNIQNQFIKNFFFLIF